MPWLRNDPVNIGNYLPNFLQSEDDFKNLLTVESSEHERQRIRIADLLNQMYIWTADWSLARWENILQLTPRIGATVEERRHAILLKLCGRQTSTLSFMGWLIDRYTDASGSYIEEHNNDYSFTINILGSITDKAGLKEAIETYKPAHLGYGFLYHVTDKDLHDEPKISGEDFLAGISSWFLDVVPYGRARNHLHYDGKWQYASALTYADFIYGGDRACGDIIKPGTIQYEPYTGWQFVFDGLAQYDGTWKYDGSYIYNGERPWVILYNDFMDELSVLVITMSRPDGSTELQDDIAARLTYGERVPYGARRIGVNLLPIDCGGYLKVTRAHPYGDTWQYGDAGRPKYNGNVRYGESWQYSKGGVHYGIDTFITAISGDLVVADPKLINPPYGERFPELEETVKANDAAEKAVLDLGEFVSEQADRHALSYGEMRYGNYASVGTNTLPVDNGGELEILKGHTYGNGRRYDYGVTATYGSSTYATMKFEGGETYGPRRYRAVL